MNEGQPTFNTEVTGTVVEKEPIDVPLACIYPPCDANGTDSIRDLQILARDIRLRNKVLETAMDRIKKECELAVEREANVLAATKPSDKSLSNQAKRDLAVLDILDSNPEYTKMKENLETNKDSLANINIDLAYLEREFRRKYNKSAELARIADAAEMIASVFVTVNDGIIADIEKEQNQSDRNEEDEIPCNERAQ